MNISYDSYRVFYYAAKYRSFSQAAAALYSNQPNVTRMIRKLESELGCALFFRSPQGVRLTPEGEKLYTHIAVAFESIEAGEEEVLSDQSLQSGIVHIAASSLALRTRLLQVLARYRRAYPHVRICLTNHSASHGLAAVQNGLADFAILAEGASVPDSLTAQKIDEIQEIPICGSAFLELTEEPVSLKRLADYPIISLTEGTSSHDFYAELFLRHGLSFSPDVEVETTAQVPPVVQSDLGVGFVPREMLYGTPEASGIYPHARRAHSRAQRLSLPAQDAAAEHRRQKAAADAARRRAAGEWKIIRQSPASFEPAGLSFSFYRFSSVSLRRLPALPAKSSARRMRRNDAP